MAHENSLTVQRPDGRWVNISGNVKGKFNPKGATKSFERGRRKSLDGASHDSMESAVEAARKRSEAFGRK